MYNCTFFRGKRPIFTAECIKQLPHRKNSERKTFLRMTIHRPLRMNDGTPMKTSWLIFLRDLSRLKKNIIAIIVIAGVCFIPSLYAWFNIYASMDPYANTGRLPVAVVNKDRGTDHERIGHLDAGGAAIEKLRGNDKMGWDFTDEETAIEGVRAGKYYAAIVIPESFSEDMASVFSTDIHQPKIIFYSNEKKNAIAPKITQSGVSSLQQGINDEFVAQVSEIMTDVMKERLGDADKYLSDAMTDLRARIASISEKTDAYQQLITQFRDLKEESDTVIADGNEAIEATRGIIDKANQSGEDLNVKITDAWNDYTTFSNDLRASVTDANQKLSEFNAELGEKIGDINGRIRELDQEFNRVTDPIEERAATILELNGELIDLLIELDAELADHELVQSVLTDFQENNERHQQILSLIQSMSAGTRDLYTYSAGTYPALRDGVTEGQSSMLSALGTLDSTAQSDAGAVFNRASSATGYLQGLMQNAETDVNSVSALIDALGSMIDNVDAALYDTESSLNTISEQFGQASADIAAIENMQIFGDLKDITEAVDSADTGKFISSPVFTQKEILYPMANYGTGMTPFFTNLAIWVGCIILVNIFKTEVDEDEKLRGFTLSQAYFGRWFLFVITSLIQAFIVCAGVMLLLGVHVEHPALYIIAGLWNAFIYMNIVYALTITFKNVGKALCVLLVILQLPGSSGTYPIEMVPAFFRSLHPFLPFKYGIAAMREAIAGMYRSYYISNLAMLLFFLAAALLTGLVIRPLLANFNRRFDRKMYDTDLMAYEGHYPARNEDYVFRGMSHIARIFNDDLKHIAKNTIVWLIVFGLAIVPCMYSYFNIAASWAPYDNVDKLKVAVANNDEGYKSGLLPVKINIGEKIMAALQNNDNLDWVLTDGDDAVEGARSGKYYAAIVVSEDFSKNMMSLFSGEDINPVIRYYSNQKMNAVSPKVTDKASAALQQEIDKAFAETAADALINVFNTITLFLDKEQTQSLLGELNDRMNSVEKNLLFASDTVNAYTDMVNSLTDLIQTTNKALEHTGSDEEADRQKFTDAAERISGLSDSFDNISGVIETVLSDGMQIYTNVDAQIAENFTVLQDDSANVSENLIGTADDVQILIDRYTGWRDSLEELVDTLENSDGIIVAGEREIDIEVGDMSFADVKTAEIEYHNARLRAATIRRLQRVISKLDTFIDKQQNLHDKLMNANELLGNLDVDIVTIHNELVSKADECYQSLSELNAEFDDRLKSVINDLSNKITEAGDDTINFKSLLNRTMADSKNLMNSAEGSLTELQGLLSETSGELQNASKDLENCINEVKNTADSDEAGQIRKLLSQNSELLASLWASPVSIETIPVYKIDNYGSSMAPFYTALSIWVGGTIMVAMMKVNVSEEKKKALEKKKRVTHTELYFGRLLIFLLIGLIQSTIIGLVDLYVLGVQCTESPFLFMLACWFSSLIYVMLIFTLTISFGDVGKAIAVILMVIQVAGSGGTFPIELAPDVFRNLYPMLPFVHTMDALRECIAGMYKNVYWDELGVLAMYLVPILILGLLLRRPVEKLNLYIEEKLEEVKFI